MWATPFGLAALDSLHSQCGGLRKILPRTSQAKSTPPPPAVVQDRFAHLSCSLAPASGRGYCLRPRCLSEFPLIETGVGDWQGLPALGALPSHPANRSCGPPATRPSSPCSVTPARRRRRAIRTPRARGTVRPATHVRRRRAGTSPRRGAPWSAPGGRRPRPPRPPRRTGGAPVRWRR